MVFHSFHIKKLSICKMRIFMLPYVRGRTWPHGAREDSFSRRLSGAGGSGGRTLIIEYSPEQKAREAEPELTC